MLLRRRAGSLPYIVDDGETVGDSESIIAHVTGKYRVTLDAGLTRGAMRSKPARHPHARRSLLGHVLFALEGRALLAGVPRCVDARASKPHRSRVAESARIQFPALPLPGIGRYAPEAAYARGLADLAVLSRAIAAGGYMHGPKPTSIDAGIYGFIANIWFFAIDTPLKAYVASQPNLVRLCEAIHEMVIRVR